MSIQESWKRVIPRSLQLMVRAARAVRHAEELDRLHHPGTEIRADLLCEVRLLVGREDLLAVLPKNGVVAEVGVAKGDLSAKILSISLPKRLHLIDRWESDKEYDAIQQRFEAEVRAGVVCLERGTSWEVLSRFEPGYLDWVYVDAGHDYASASSDLAASSRCIKAGGYLAGHDYTRWAVSNGKLNRYGVVEAVNEFANSNDAKLAFLTNQRHRHLSFALKIVNGGQ